MSHTVSVKTQFRDPGVVEQTARELGLEIIRGEVKLFASKHQNCIGIKLPKWNFPVAIDTTTGEAHFDNYNGKWGKQSELDRFTQHYAANVATQAAQRKGWIVTRKIQSNGNIQLQVTGC